jgi:Delta7-sterol 5-desaturase
MDLPANLLDVIRQTYPAVIIFDGTRYLLAASLMTLVVWLLRKTTWRRFALQMRQATSSDYRRELLASTRSVLVYAVVVCLTVWAANNHWIAGYRYDAPDWQTLIYLPAILIAHDAYFYWTHRLMHHRTLFKYFHRTHHRSVTPTPFAAYAFDVPEAIVQVGFVPLWLLFIPTPGYVLVLFVLFQIVRNVMGHCGMEIHPKGMADHWLGGQFTTTTHHDMHHSGSFNHNFGLYFTWWDRLMGTENPTYLEAFREVKARQLMVAPE